MYEGALQNTPEFMYKKLCVYSYMFKLHSPSQYSPFDAAHLLRHFSTAQNSFELVDLMPFSSCAVFCFTSSTLAKHFPLRTFFICENEQTNTNVTWGQIGWIGKVGGRGHAIFGQKLLNTPRRVAGALVNHPSWNGPMHWKNLQKRFTEAECRSSQQHQLVQWYRWVPRTLT